MPGFASQLLALCAVVPVAGYSLPAATYLKNYVRTSRLKDDSGTGLSPGERTTVRSQLLEVVMRADGAVLKQLAEAVRPPHPAGARASLRNAGALQHCAFHM